MMNWGRKGVWRGNGLIGVSKIPKGYQIRDEKRTGTLSAFTISRNTPSLPTHTKTYHAPATPPIKKGGHEKAQKTEVYLMVFYIGPKVRGETVDLDRLRYGSQIDGGGGLMA